MVMAHSLSFSGDTDGILEEIEEKCNQKSLQLRVDIGKRDSVGVATNNGVQCSTMPFPDKNLGASLHSQQTTKTNNITPPTVQYSAMQYDDRTIAAAPFIDSQVERETHINSDLHLKRHELCCEYFVEENGSSSSTVLQSSLPPKGSVVYTTLQYSDC